MNNIKRAIITGAAGFTGVHLVNKLLLEGIEVYAIVRPNSMHNSRLQSNNYLLHVIELEPDQYINIDKYVSYPCDIFYHLMWTEGKSWEEQRKNTLYSLDAIKSAKMCGCSRYICTGSQAEYGIVPMQNLMCEEITPSPITYYGKAKVEACKITRLYAKENDIEWVWARIFSLIGYYEPPKRMLPTLFINLYSHKTTNLSSCRQNWDYLDVRDAANALLALGLYGQNEEIYNVANGNFRPLKEYTEELKSLLSSDAEIVYGDDPNPFISLQPSIKKISNDTSWFPIYNFKDSINEYYNYLINI